MTADKLMPKSVKTLLSVTFNYPDINLHRLKTHVSLLYATFLMPKQLKINTSPPGLICYVSKMEK